MHILGLEVQGSERDLRLEKGSQEGSTEDGNRKDKGKLLVGAGQSPGWELERRPGQEGLEVEPGHRMGEDRKGEHDG